MQCDICGRTKKITKTPCCNNYICDDLDKHIADQFPYPRRSCFYNHQHITICGKHYQANHDGNWKDCLDCKEIDDYEYYVSNDHNFETLPGYSVFDPITCPSCSSKIILAENDHIATYEGFYCTPCDPRAKSPETTISMSIKEILEAFNQDHPVPELAIQAAIQQKEIITPYLLNILKETARNPFKVGFERKDPIIAMHLLAQFNESQAFPYIIKIANFHENLVDEFLGDFITESLVSLIVSTYDGNLQLIKSLIENKNAHTWCRVAGINSLQGLFLINKISRAEFINYHKKLIHSDLKNNEILISDVIENVCDIQPSELHKEIAELFDNNLIDEWCVDRNYAFAMSKKSIEECIQHSAQHSYYYLPMINAAKVVAFMYKEKKEQIEKNKNHDKKDSVFNKDMPLSLEDLKKNYPNYDFTMQLTNPEKTGRNEQCPCNSGKKYKRCCFSNDSIKRKDFPSTFEQVH